MDLELELSTRIAALEAAASRIATVEPFPTLAHLIADVGASGALGCALHRVTPNYYGLDLPARAAQLRCTPDQLCKTLVFENVHPARPAASPALGDAQYIAVVLQYTARLDADALERWLKRAGAGAVKLRAAEGMEALTGFAHNGVSIFGSRRPLPVVVAKSIASLRYIWLGGGEPDVKLRVFVRQLLWCGGWPGQPGGPAVVDCTLPRGEAGEGEEE